MEQIIIAIIGSGAFTAIVSASANAIITWLSNRKNQKSGLECGMRLILKDRLRFLCVRYIEQGWIYEDELEDLMSMHEVYHDKLGGNGYLDTLMGRVKSLEIKGVGIL